MSDAAPGQAQEGVPFREAIERGSLERLSPILMTALPAGLALIPPALDGGEPGNELQAPIAIVILGGLISATALNMVVLPALYWLFGDRSPARNGVDDPLGDMAESVQVAARGPGVVGRPGRGDP